MRRASENSECGQEFLFHQAFLACGKYLEEKDLQHFIEGTLNQGRQSKLSDTQIGETGDNLYMSFDIILAKLRLSSMSNFSGGT